MTHQEITEKLQIIFRTVFSTPDIVVYDELNAEKVDRWDSLTHLTMIAEVENEFGVKFKLKELISMKNVGDMIRLIIDKKQA
jgi:acyl carrier protein